MKPKASFVTVGFLFCCAWMAVSPAIGCLCQDATAPGQPHLTSSAGGQTEASSTAQSDSVITVENYRHQTVVRTSVVLIRGTLPAESKDLEIKNRNATEQMRSVSTTVHDGKFKALVELVQGDNHIEIRALGTDALKLTLRYQPLTNPYYVRLVWMTDKTGDRSFITPDDDVSQDYESRMRTAALLMQTFTAEKMNDLGLGRRTFRLERDQQGKVIVHTWAISKEKEYYFPMDRNQWWLRVRDWLLEDHKDRFAKNIVLAAYTRMDPQKTGKALAQTALGGDNLALFGSGSFYSWPLDIQDAIPALLDEGKVDSDRILDDSGGRSTRWGLVATTIGATLHELGHTFGLPHSNQPRDIMTRGFDGFNRAFTLQDPPSARGEQVVLAAEDEAHFAPISATFLRHHRWFESDVVKYKSSIVPRVRFNNQEKTLAIRSKSGIAWIGVAMHGRMVGYQHQDQPYPKEIELSYQQLKELAGGKQVPTSVSVMSANGRYRVVERIRR